MSLQSQFSLVNSEFNGFLHAAIGEEKSGMELTVLSALTRLGLDPWGEARRLADLPKEAATRALTAAIASLPAGRWKASDLSAIAARLVDRLPSRSAAVPLLQTTQGIVHRTIIPRTTIWLAVLALVLALSYATLYWHVDEASAPQSNAVSSAQ